MKTKLPYVWAPVVKGKPYTYYRRDGQKIRIEGPLSLVRGELVPSPAWLENYHRIHSGFEDKPKGAAPLGEHKPGSLGALIAHFKSAPEFTDLKKATRDSYRRYMDKVLGQPKYAKLMVATMPREFVLELRDEYRYTPRKANYIVTVLKLLLSFAMERPSIYGVQVNPAAKVKGLRTGDGHDPWEEWQVEQFRAHWRPGTVERMAFELLLNTGQRAEDVAAMTRPQRLAGGWIKVRQLKTNELVEIPETQDLTKAFEGWKPKPINTNRWKKVGDDPLVILSTMTGRPMTIDYFKKMMGNAIAEAGLKGCTTHGLRYTAATRLREAGCEWPLIADIVGHRTAEMARKYSEKRRRSRIAITRLDKAIKARRKAAAAPSSDE